MTEQIPFPATVLLRATAEVNGRNVQAQVAVERQAWNVGPEVQDRVKAEALRLLGEEIVQRLAPEVTVLGAEPTLRESLDQALRPFDYPSEY